MKNYRIIVTLKNNYSNEIEECVMDRTEFSNFARYNDVCNDYEILNTLKVTLL